MSKRIVVTLAVMIFAAMILLVFQVRSWAAQPITARVDEFVIFNFVREGMNVPKPNNINSLCSNLGYDEAAQNDRGADSRLVQYNGDSVAWVICVRKKR